MESVKTQAVKVPKRGKIFVIPPPPTTLFEIADRPGVAFGSIKSVLEHVVSFGSILEHFGVFLRIFGNFGSFSSSLRNFGAFWEILENF